MPAGVVDRVIAALEKKGERPVAEYTRHGGLYLAELELSGFARQGQGA